MTPPPRPPLTLTPRERTALLVVVALLVAVRLATLGWYPLMDSTESRYGEIARKMLETGNWVMPQYDYGVPFWGKPPLSIWLSAAAMATFGVNEFAVRMPSLVLAVGCGALVGALARRRGGRDAALWAVAFFATTGLTFVAAGAVMTDAALLFGTALSMVAFWLALDTAPPAARGWRYAFFLGVAIGLMAKGPIAVVLTALPIAGWTLWTNRWRDVWTRLPWLAGTLAVAALVLPWYGLAERAAPGFLQYFLVGEHWKRFVEPGWQGDLYGAAHARPRGTIWLYGLIAALPWSIPALAWIGRAAWKRPADLRALVTDRWLSYLTAWTLAPLAFFTLSGNVLTTYVWPAMPALALLLATLWLPGAQDARRFRPDVRHVVVTGAVLCVLLVGGIAWEHRRFERDLSSKALVRTYESARGATPGRLLYLGTRPYSAEFYSGGRAVRVDDLAALAPYLLDATPDFVVVPSRDVDALPAAVRMRLAPLGEFGEYQLFRESMG